MYSFNYVRRRARKGNGYISWPPVYLERFQNALLTVACLFRIIGSTIKERPPTEQYTILCAMKLWSGICVGV